MGRTTVKLSPSSLNAWYEAECPAKWKFQREWEPIVEEDYFTRGSLVHKLLEGKADPTNPTLDGLALSMYRKLENLRQGLGMNILAKEFTQVFRLPENPDVMWTRRIDALVMMGGEFAIVDYKTGASQWKVTPSGDKFVAPQSMGAQAIGYLIPSTKHLMSDMGIGTKQAWPTKIYFMIAPMRGSAQLFEYSLNEEDLEHFNLSVKLAAQAIRTCQDEELFPKVRGKHCLECKMKPICFGEEGYEKVLKPKIRTD